MAHFRKNTCFRNLLELFFSSFLSTLLRSGLQLRVVSLIVCYTERLNLRKEEMLDRTENTCETFKSIFFQSVLLPFTLLRSGLRMFA